MLLDMKDFEKRIAGAESALQRFFDADGLITFSRAPGCLDVMGGVGLYTGSTQLAATIGEAAHAAIQLRGDTKLRIWTRSGAGDDDSPIIERELGDVVAGVANENDSDECPRRCECVRLIGNCFEYLMRQIGSTGSTRGANIVLESRIPIGAGLGSSDAVIAATLVAIDAAYSFNIAPEQLASRGTQVRQSGLQPDDAFASQMATVFGHKGKLLVYRCQTHEIDGYEPLPAGVRIYGITSGKGQAAANVPVNRGRIGAALGLDLINRRRAELGDSPIGHLSELTPNKYRRDYAAVLPSRILGSEYNRTVGRDCETPGINPVQLYSVRAASEHVIYESYRVSTFLTSLEEVGNNSGARVTLGLIRAGEAMYGSHWSYTRTGRGCRETTQLVRMAREAGPSRGIFGARITGAGSGGTVAVLTYGSDADATVREIAAAYTTMTGNEAHVVLAGKSPGAAEFGTRTTTGF
ncbi:MAG TPA: hypothetical protein VGK19_08360 [Capsulimonadaceae bacterium]|jgi:L-arabinokinase